MARIVRLSFITLFNNMYTIVIGTVFSSFLLDVVFGRETHVKAELQAYIYKKKNILMQFFIYYIVTVVIYH